jgi:hypothetical protein
MVKNTFEIDDTWIKQAIRASGGEYLFHTGGNCAFIWLKNPAQAAQVANGLVNTLAPAPFAYVSRIDGGSYTYSRVTGPGAEVSDELEAAYQYLLGTFAGPLCPDIMLVFEEDTITRLHHPQHHGEHGGATWGAQQIPLVIAGPGVFPGAVSQFPARLMDIAPTVLMLLGIEPTHMDGVALTDALLTYSSAQVSAQDAIAPLLTAHQDAIIGRSAADVAAQKTPLPAPQPGPPFPTPRMP